MEEWYKTITWPTEKLLTNDTPCLGAQCHASNPGYTVPLRLKLALLSWIPTMANSPWWQLGWEDISPNEHLGTFPRQQSFIAHCDKAETKKQQSFLWGFEIFKKTPFLSIKDFQKQMLKSQNPTSHIKNRLCRFFSCHTASKVRQKLFGWESSWAIPTSMCCIEWVGKTFQWLTTSSAHRLSL